MQSEVQNPSKSQAINLETKFLVCDYATPAKVIDRSSYPVPINGVEPTTNDGWREYMKSVNMWVVNALAVNSSNVNDRAYTSSCITNVFESMKE